MPRSPDHLAVTLERHTTALNRRQSAEDVESDPFNIDEWDPSRGAFWQHAVAGSVAGLAEHSLMFPMDTMKTHMQVSNTTVKLSELIASCGVPRLWRGVQTMFAGCVPAHAAYFSIYETSRDVCTASLANQPAALAIDNFAGTVPGSTAEAVGAGAAVSLATVVHDLVMTPMDVLKQRLQLGRHKNSIVDAFNAIMREQGPRAFTVSLPLTLGMNMPYAAIMGSSNEAIRKRLCPEGQPSAPVYMAAGASSGAIAAAFTAPLDAIKTHLQTQRGLGSPPDPATEVTGAGARKATAATAPQLEQLAFTRQPLAFTNARDAARALYQEGGFRPFYRGVGARILTHAPAVGISWTTYETAKHLLERTWPASAATQTTTSGLKPKPSGVRLFATPPATEETADGRTGTSARPPPSTSATVSLPLMDHMIAGSLAGMFEHAVVFPIDTVKTHVQAASVEEMAARGTMGTARGLVQQHGASYLFRGLSALLPAIGPAHALMFASYEQVLLLGGAKEHSVSPERVALVGAAAGVVSTILHDSCMVPAETMKQRLQLGYYKSATHCFQVMLASGGSSFFRSLPPTLAMNIPYGSAMMMINETLKKWLNPSGDFHVGVFLFSGGFAGAVAAGLTTPLDVVKTRLQVQSLSAPTGAVGTSPGEAYFVRYGGSMAAIRTIYAESGTAGFFRGLGPRMAMFGPSCAISWVTYESIKKLLLQWRTQQEQGR